MAFVATIKHGENCQATLFKMTCSHSESNSDDHGDGDDYHGDHDGDDNDEMRVVFFILNLMCGRLCF